MKTTEQTLSDQQLFLLAHRRHHHFVHFARIFMLLLFLTVWELFADFHIIDSFFFSSPSRVVACFVRMVSERSLFTHIGITLTETVISFFLVALVSLSTATLLWYSRRLSEILEPFLVVLNSLPKSALAPLLIVWLGTGMDTIIAAGISVAIFGAIINLYTGFLQADPEKLLLIRTLGGTRRDCFFKVVLPASIPVILSNMKVNIVSRRRYRRISRCQTRARLSDHLRKPGTAAGYAHYIHPAFVYHCDGALSATAVCRALL